MFRLQPVLLSLLVSFNLASLANAAASATPEEVDVRIEHVFAPKGFDSNDNVQVFAKGWLPSPCYQAPHGNTVHSPNPNNLIVGVKASFVKDRACIQMAVPFLEPISVGHLPEGNFNILVEPDMHGSIRSAITITAPHASSGDDHTYARVEKITANKNNHVTLSGSNPSDCVALDRIDVVSNGTDTYSILPIMKQIHSNCPRVAVPFEYHLDVPNERNSHDVLLHVRVLDGKSINYLIPKN